MKKNFIILSLIASCLFVSAQNGINEINMAIKSDPCALNYLKRIRYNRDMGLDSLILPDIEHIISITNDSSLLTCLYTEAGFNYDKKKNFEKSYEYYSLAIEISTRLKKLEIPIELRKYLVIQSPTYDLLYCNRGFSLYHQKKYIDAQKDFLKADTNSGRALIGLALCYYELENKTKAITLLKDAIKKEQSKESKTHDFFIACSELAKVYEIDKNYSEAIKYIIIPVVHLANE